MTGSWLKNFTLCTWKERLWVTDSKNTKISIFIKMDIGLFKITGHLDLGLCKIGGAIFTFVHYYYPLPLSCFRMAILFLFIILLITFLWCLGSLTLQYFSHEFLSLVLICASSLSGILEISFKRFWKICLNSIATVFLLASVGIWWSNPYGRALISTHQLNIFQNIWQSYWHPQERANIALKVPKILLVK